MEQKEYEQIIHSFKLKCQQEILKGKVRKVFLECLPVTYKGLNWKLCHNKFVYFIYEDVEGFIEIIEYIQRRQQLIIKYNNKKYKVRTKDFLNCGLGKVLNKRTFSFKIEINTRFQDNKRDIIVTDREYRKDSNRKTWKWYKYTCNVCGWTEGWMDENNLLKGIGCSCCHGNTVVKGINDIATTHPYLVKYFLNIEDAYTHTYSSNKKALMRCDDCESQKEMTVFNLYKKGFNCKKCGDSISYPEKILFNILEQLKINFKTQLSKTTFKWIKDYRYDFYIPILNIIIETHGNQHYEDTSGVYTKTLKEEQENDKLKKELALQNRIKPENYIVIDCRKSELEWIRDNNNGILNSRLNEIFDLQDIDWLKAEEFALNSRVVEACKLWSSGIKNAVKISEIMKLSYVTVRKYLKQGSNIWNWCDYGLKKETKKEKSVKKERYTNKKPLRIKKDNMSLGIFESCAELERQSLKLFGVKLNSAKISEVCNGKRKYHQGFTFEFVLDLLDKHNDDNKIA